MKVTFLGTGTSQGVPVIGCPCAVCRSTDPLDSRLRSSVLIQTDQVHLVIDTGPDFRYQMLRAQVDRLDAVLFTHGHKDHTAGFDDIRAFNYIQRRAMEVYADERVEEVLKRDFYYCFLDFKYPGIPVFNLHRIQNESFEVNGLQIVPIALMHHKLPVFGFRIGDFCYITDANSISAEEKEKVMGCKILVLNALRRDPHLSHFNLEEAIELAGELKVEHCYLTHMSHQMGLHRQVERELPKGIHLAYDGLALDL